MAAGIREIRHDNRPKTDVSLPSPSARSRPTIDVLASLTLVSRDVTTVDGIPGTTVARTLVDLGDVLSRRAVERAVDQAEVLRVFDGTAAQEAIERAGRRRGAATLRAVLESYDEPA